MRPSLMRRRCLPPHAPVLDEREPLPLPRRRRHAVLAQQVPRHLAVGPRVRVVEARRDAAAAAAPGGCVGGRPRTPLGAQAVGDV